jgi:hypothetical protein
MTSILCRGRETRDGCHARMSVGLPLNLLVASGKRTMPQDIHSQSDEDPQAFLPNSHSQGVGRKKTGISVLEPHISESGATMRLARVHCDYAGCASTASRRRLWAWGSKTRAWVVFVDEAAEDLAFVDVDRGCADEHCRGLVWRLKRE